MAIGTSQVHLKCFERDYMVDGISAGSIAETTLESERVGPKSIFYLTPWDVVAADRLSMNAQSSVDSSTFVLPTGFAEKSRLVPHSYYLQKYVSIQVGTLRGKGKIENRTTRRYSREKKKFELFLQPFLFGFRKSLKTG